METKKFTQTGTFSIAVLASLLFLSLVLLILFGLKEIITGAAFGFFALSMLVCLLIFYKLTIYIDDTSVSFSFGIGLISKKYLLKDIRSCQAVVNKPLYGIGIRIIPGGWLYSVSGLKAIELTFKSKKTKVRIGTDKPDEIAAIINQRIGADEYESAEDKRERSRWLLAVLFLSIALIVPVFVIITGHKATEISMTDSALSIKGMYGLTVRYSEIRQLDTLDALPTIKFRTNGYAFENIYKGNFLLQDQTKAKLFIMYGNPPYIFIKTGNLNIYLNMDNRVKTIDLFKTLRIKSGNGKE